MHLKVVVGLIVAMGVGGWSGTAQAAPKYTCYISDNFVVSSSAKDDDTVFAVMNKQSADEQVLCPIDPAKAEFIIGADTYGQTYTDMIGDLFILTAIDGQTSNLQIIDLRTHKTVLNVRGSYELATGESVYYWESGEPGTPQTCENYDEITANGLDIEVLHEKEFDLATFESKLTGLTDCQGVS